MESLDERNRFILRRTLSAICWIYVAWCALLGAPLVLFPRDEVRLRAWLLLGHAVLFAVSGHGLWKPRRWGWAATLLAALGGLGFVILDLLRRQPGAALIDAVFPVCAAGIYWRAREPRLDRSSGQE